MQEEVTKELPRERYLVTEFICDTVDDWFQSSTWAACRCSVQYHNRSRALMIQLSERYLAHMLVVVYVYILRLLFLLILGGLQWRCFWFLPSDAQNQIYACFRKLACRLEMHA